MKTTRLVGYMDVKSEIPITVTDPCYDRNLNAGIEVNVTSGKYACMVELGTEHYHFKLDDGRVEEGYDTRVWKSYIILDKYAFCDKELEMPVYVGKISVDAGLAGFYQNKPDFTNDLWSEFCNKLSKFGILVDYNGFCSDSGYGDGSYPVYIYSSHGKIVKIEIVFITENDDDDDE